jgi:uncharacterized RDD family membrane protein YckC
MTQQNETEHQNAGPEQPQAGPLASPLAPTVPVYPSPYLDGGEAVPQAYPAPAQPGQPRYGTPSALGRRPVGAGQQRYGQPQAARPMPARAAATRDPAIAPAWNRLAASTLDWFIIILVSVIAFWSPLSQITRQLQAVVSRYPGGNSPAAVAAFNSILRDPANERALVYWVLTMYGIALAYFWVQHAAWGATVGKRVLGVRVVRAADRSKIGIRQAGIRTVSFLAGPAILMLLINPINYVGAVLWAADAGLPLLDPQAQSLHDKLAGTVVVRQRWLDQRSRGPEPW